LAKVQGQVEIDPHCSLSQPITFIWVTTIHLEVNGTVVIVNSKWQGPQFPSNSPLLFCLFLILPKPGIGYLQGHLAYRIID